MLRSLQLRQHQLLANQSQQPLSRPRNQLQRLQLRKRVACRHRQPLIKLRLRLAKKKKTPQLATSQPKQYTPTGSSLRISALKRQAEKTLTAQQASAAEADEDSDASATGQRDEPFTPDELLKWWFAFADEELTDDAYLSQLLHTVTPELQPPHGLKVSLVSNIQLESFERVERTLLRYLKAKLHNDNLTLTTEVAAVEQTQHASTAQERAAYYVENYKEVAYLTKTLDLRVK